MRKYVLTAMFCLFISQADIAFGAIPFKRHTPKSHTVYHAKYTETVKNRKIVGTHFCMTPVKTNLRNYTEIKVEAFSREIDGADLDARLWHQALVFLLRTEGDKRIASSSVSLSAVLSDTIHTTHELYILSPAIEAHIILDPVKRQVNGTYTIRFGLPSFRGKNS
ncbi:MAG: hypothetical protein RBR43_07750 [Desulfuromonadaceae bacterium]|nr:hypothetical protein [Desulfuromonas sp.]MDY0185753.1 hypothetical protein [Desulfuromonadaceae bacterium]